MGRFGLCVCVCVHVCSHSYIVIWIYLYAYGGQRTSSTIPQMLSTLYLRQDCHWNLPGRLDWRAIPGTFLSKPPQHWVYNMFSGDRTQALMLAVQHFTKIPPYLSWMLLRQLIWSRIYPGLENYHVSQQRDCKQ